MEPLAKLKVVEMGQLIAGPFAAKTLADFGADVIKIEPPKVGDALRKWRLLKDGTSVWWQVQSRNKKSLSLDLREAEAQEIEAKFQKEETDFANKSNEIKELYLKFDNLPKTVRTKYSRAEWQVLDTWRKESIWNPVVKGRTQITSKKYLEKSAPFQFGLMYKQFVDKEAIMWKERGQFFSHSKLINAFHDYYNFIEEGLLNLEIARKSNELAYTKGFETSFGKSNTVDVLYKRYGVLVKRQNGDKISSLEVQAIEDGIKIFYKHIFDVSDAMRADNMVVSHSGKVLMYATNALGIFIAFAHAVGVSEKYGKLAFNEILAHEFGHFVDNYVGKKYNVRMLSEKRESLPNDIAFAMRATMNQKSSSKYINSSVECFARAIQQYVSISEYGENAFAKFSNEYEATTDDMTAMPYFEHPHFVNKENYYTMIKPLVEEFIRQYADDFTQKPISMADRYSIKLTESLRLAIEA